MNATEPEDAHAQIAAVIAAERETLSRVCRLDPAALDAFLADDFHEFGRSGGELTKVGTAERVARGTAEDSKDSGNSEGSEEITVEHLRGQLVSDGVVMVKYTAAAGGRRTHRTSLWRHDPLRGWQLFHHQGTPTD
ncbi:MAG: nuclear transport factor 2 family protein [Terracoccus sp.]